MIGRRLEVTDHDSTSDPHNSGAVHCEKIITYNNVE